MASDEPTAGDDRGEQPRHVEGDPFTEGDVDRFAEQLAPTPVRVPPGYPQNLTVDELVRMYPGSTFEDNELRNGRGDIVRREIVWYPPTPLPGETE